MLRLTYFNRDFKAKPNAQEQIEHHPINNSIYLFRRLAIAMLKKSSLFVIMFFGVLFSSHTLASAGYYLDKLYSSPPSGLLVQDKQGRTLHQYKSQRAFMPASTVKILTAYMALEHWGLDYRFHTDFMLDNKGFLWVKGYGDPYLVSEEMRIIAQQIAQRLRNKQLSSLRGIIIDDSYYNSPLSQMNTPRSLNPYDAPLNAVSANFNSVGFHKKQYELSPIEWQTPITPLVGELSDLVGNGKKRISLRNPYQASRYFKELLTEFLRQDGIQVQHQQYTGQAKAIPLLYRHYNSRNLSEVVQNMLKFSNNFIANQLFLNLGVEASQKKASASMHRSQSYAKHFINRNFAWKNYFIADGAGLSRESQISPNQMVDLLRSFEKYYYLLPCIKEGQVCAKTGTLSNVHSYAGYFVDGSDLHPFAIMVEQRMPYKFRKKMASALFDSLFGYQSYQSSY